MSPTFEMRTMNSYIDEQMTIKVIGCVPHTNVSIQAVAYDEEQKKFCSSATFRANDEGEVDVPADKPIEGTYDEIDGSGLFWSMERADSTRGDYFMKKNAILVKKSSGGIELHGDVNVRATLYVRRLLRMERG